ncbi:histidine phosphatase family protein [Kineococcus sp. NPDC059986]|uniref:histidine phosphatase family protein n=1 Tax=Kineococcus sp. NPDC059986 TaxID=3155538 RepID=UPI0034506E86
MTPPHPPGTVVVVQHAEKGRGADPGLTRRGVRQAHDVAAALADHGVRAVHASPRRRTRQTAAPLARALGLATVVEADLAERMEWVPGTQTVEEFLADWGRATADRDHRPRSGDSSRAAGDRLDAALRRLATTAPVVAVTHGGVTVDFLRTTFGDGAVPVHLDADGVPPGALTALALVDGVWRLVRLAATDHLTV